MIPMSCPGCGRPGTIPPDKLNSRMHCKKCDAVFHMDATGHIVLGEPPRPGEAPKKRARAMQTGSSNASLGEMWKDVPIALKVAFAAAPLFLVFYYFVLPSLTATVGPESYAAEVSRAAIEGNKDKVAKLSTPSSGGAGGEWVDKLRADVGERSSARGLMITASLMDGSEKTKVSSFAVTVTDPAPTGTNLGSFVLGLVMERQDDGKYLLDGVATKAAFKPSAPPKDQKKN